MTSNTSVFTQQMYHHLGNEHEQLEVKRCIKVWVGFDLFCIGEVLISIRAACYRGLRWHSMNKNVIQTSAAVHVREGCP